MGLLRKKSSRLPEYFGDPVFPIGDLEPGMAVYMWVDPDEKRICFRHGGDETSLKYGDIVHFVVDNEERIRDGESTIAAEVLADVPKLSGDSLTRIEQNTRWMSTRWFGELLYTDADGNRCSAVLMERKRSGYNLDVIKSMQASDMEKFVAGFASG